MKRKNISQKKLIAMIKKYLASISNEELDKKLQKIAKECGYIK